MKKIIATEKAPAALGPYAQAVLIDGTLYGSGQLGICPQTGQLVETFDAQVKQVMDNIGAVLHAAEMDYNNIVKTMIFVDDLANFDALNVIYARYFDAETPARSCVQAAKIPKGAKVEIEFIAVK